MKKQRYKTQHNTTADLFVPPSPPPSPAPNSPGHNHSPVVVARTLEFAIFFRLSESSPKAAGGIVGVGPAGAGVAPGSKGACVASGEGVAEGSSPLQGTHVPTAPTQLKHKVSAGQPNREERRLQSTSRLPYNSTSRTMASDSLKIDFSICRLE